MRQPPPILGAATQPITVEPSTTCPKCGKIKKSQKLSCCARGGAWFNKCGEEGDSNFDHTWAEGKAACKGFAGLLLNEAQGQDSQRRETTLIQLGTTRDSHALRKQAITDSIPAIVSDAEGKEYSKIATLVGLCLVISLTI